MRLRRLLVRQWWNRPGRAIATVASVAVAVGAVVATWVSADASRAGYRRLTESIDGIASIDIVGRGGGRFDIASLPGGLADVPGVRAVVPLFYRPTLLRVGEKRVREMAVGIDLESMVAADLLELAAGRPCEGPDEVVLETSLADSLGLDVDGELLFFARRRIRRMKVVGLVDRMSIAWFAEGAGVIADIRSLSDMSLSLGFVDRVRVALESGAERTRVRADVAARLPDSLLAEIPAGKASMAEDVLHSADLGLDFVTGLTVAMAFFIVGNAMLMSVTERRRGFSLLRLLGATVRQMRRFVIAEAAMLGCVGALIGAAVGWYAAAPISAGITQALQTPLSSLAFNPLIMPAAVLMGIAVAIAAAWWPSREATDADLLEGLSVAPAARPRGLSWRFVAAVLTLGGLAAVGQMLVIAEILPPRVAVIGGVMMLLAFVALTPLVLPWIARGLAALAPRRFRIETTLALEQILRQPIRTALTSGVLVVAVTNGIGLGHAIRDNVDNVLGWYTRLMRADWLLMHAGVVSAAGAEEGNAETRSVEAEVAGLAGVRRVEGIGVAVGRVAGTACVVVARDIPADEPLPLTPVGLSESTLRAALDRGEVAAGTVLARRTGIAPGDELSVEVFGRTTTVRVAGLVVDYTSGGASIHLRRDVARRLFGMEAADVLLVRAEPGQADALRGPLADIADHHSLLLRSFADMQSIIDTVVKGVVGSLWAILGLGFVVGSLGVANTVTMNVLEKQRTLGLLRAVGMTSRQVTLVVVMESLLLGAAGGLIGLVGGITTALFIQLASQPLLGHPIEARFRPGVVVVNLLAAVVVAVVAAWLPARRAARLDLLEAISAE
ncbi:MAG: ABC transporter permease [Planctomycetia bacterium]